MRALQSSASLKKVKNGTEITIVQSSVAGEHAAELAKGWNQFYWTPLKEYFSRNK